MAVLPTAAWSNWFTRSESAGSPGTCIFRQLWPIPRPCPGSTITLFRQTLWKEAEEDQTFFCEEVRMTYLHELGHYLGWDEDQVEAYGL